MPEPVAHWIGKDERGGIPVPARPDVPPPPHWRLEAIAAVERPRSLTLGADGRTAVYIQDRDTSDIWLLDLERGVPERLTSGREPAPYWEDVEPRLSPDGSQVAYGDEGAVWIVPTAGGPQRRLAKGSSPVWLDEARLSITVERDRASRLDALDVHDPCPRPLARH
ncbi:MAG TPA: hypothetical protein VK896_07680, partial [Gaiellaceae bacterium]|nr:hypothetical protein [Gaiellaceae bacterium]